MAKTNEYKRREITEPILCACGCGNYLNRFDKKGREKRFINHHHPISENGKLILSKKYKERIPTPEKHPAWKGGEKIQLGYVKILEKNNPNADHQGYVKRCTLAAQKVLGRPLKKWVEVVHHIDGNRANDKNNNLLICSREYHNTLHERMKLCKIFAHK